MARCCFYQLPTDTSIFGPTQVEARIDQTPEIAAQITLWDQAGSSVIRGNLIVVPVGGSFVYLSPIYLQSTSSAFPQFTKIVVATPSKVVWADTLEEALRRAVGRAQRSVPIPRPDSPDADTGRHGRAGRHAASRKRRHADRCQRSHRLRQRALPSWPRRPIGSGDYVTYGKEMALVQTALDRLAEMTGGSPAP